MNKLLKTGLIVSVFALGGTLNAMEKQPPVAEPAAKQPEIQSTLGWFFYKCYVPVPAIQWVGENVLGYEYTSRNSNNNDLPPCEESIEDFSVMDFSLIKPLSPRERQQYLDVFFNGDEVAQGAQRPAPLFDDKTYEQILKDIPRTHLDFRPGFFSDKKMAQSLTRVLFAWSKKYPEMGYSQGYNDIAAHLLVRLFDAFYRFKPVARTVSTEDAEMDSHWIFQSYEHVPTQEEAIERMSGDDLTSLEAHVFTCLDRVLGSFLKATKAGRDSAHLLRMNRAVTEILASADPELSEHLTAILDLCSADLTPVIVAWNTYFFSRELSPKALAVLWDAYLLDEAEGGFALLHPYVCCALIEALREHILSLDATEVDSFTTVIRLLREPPIGHWDLDRVAALVKRAQNMRSFRPHFVADFASQLKAQVPTEQDERHSLSFDSDSFVAFVLEQLVGIETGEDYELFVADALSKYPHVDATTLNLFSQRLQKRLKEGFAFDVKSAKFILNEIEKSN